jgi:hypothetical protein
MGTIWIRDIKGGLDTRRLPETLTGGAAIRAQDGHVNRGGEFEQRAAFVNTYSLPAGLTVSIGAGVSGIYVFGSGAPPANMPKGVTYQQLQHPDGITPIVRVLSSDLFQSQIYAVAEYSDGTIYHFYNGVRVTDWQDGRARVSFEVTGGGLQPAVSAMGSFSIFGGSNIITNTIANITLNGVEILGVPVEHTGNNATTATAVAAQINAFVSSPDYSAAAVGSVVNISTSIAGSAGNGLLPVLNLTGDVAVNAITALAGGLDAAPSQLTDLTVNGVSVMAGPVSWAIDNPTTAQAIADSINLYASTPDYTATVVGAKINLLAVDPGTSTAAAGSFTVSAGAAGSAFTSIQLNSVEVLGATVNWTTDNPTTAAAIAAQINLFDATPGYTAVAVGALVTITAETQGVGPNGFTPALTMTGSAAVTGIAALAGGSISAPNGFVVNFAISRGLVMTPGSGVMLSNGISPIFQSGTFAKTIGSKEYVTSGPDLNFSAVLGPTQFQDISANIGAGFIDMSTQAAGSEALQAVGKFLSFIAVFAERVVQIWFVDPDPANNAIQQVLSNIGTLSPRSVVQFGDTDLFFLDESGVRSLRSRYAQTLASTDDIGNPIDTLIQAKIRPMTTLQRAGILGLIEPTDGRFWILFSDQIFVFSFFNGSKVSAWSTYTPSVNNVPFTIDDAVAFKKKVYVRSGDTIYVYGGIGNDLAYDSTTPELWLPYMDAEKPSETKDFETIDVACVGNWLVSAGLEPLNLDAVDKIATVSGTSYTGDSIPFEASSTHISLRFKGVGPGPKTLAAATINFKGDDT